MANNIENQFLGNILATERKLTKAGDELLAYFKQKAEVKKPDLQSELMSFVNPEKGHTEEDILKDIKKVLRARETASPRDHTDRGDMFEKLFEEFGEHFFKTTCSEIQLIKTGEYDDRIGSIDFILEGTKEDGKKFRVSIDLTVSDNFDRTYSKTQKTITNITQEGKLGEIKYGYFENGKKRQRSVRAPRVVIALTSEQFDNLAELTLDVIKNNNASEIFSNSNFSKSFIRQMIGELEMQLSCIEEFQSTIIERNNSNDQIGYNVYKKMLKTTQEALENIKKIQKEKTP